MTKELQFAETPIDLERLRRVAMAATPGPWWHDMGNGQIESQNKAYHRAVICDRPSSWEPSGELDANDEPIWHDPRYECCPKAVRISVGNDMEHIEAFDPLTAIALIDRIEKAEAHLREADAHRVYCANGWDEASAHVLELLADVDRLESQVKYLKEAGAFGGT